MQRRDTYDFHGFAPDLSFALFQCAGTPGAGGQFHTIRFSFISLLYDRTTEARAYPVLRRLRSLLPCSFSSDCTVHTGDERSAAFEWAAWQFNRPEQSDGMVQVFRRDKSPEQSKNLRLRGIDATAIYEIDNVDTQSTREMSGKDLIEQGLSNTHRATRIGTRLLQESSLVDPLRSRLPLTVALSFPKLPPRSLWGSAGRPTVSLSVIAYRMPRELIRLGPSALLSLSRY